MDTEKRQERLNDTMMKLQLKYGNHIVQTVSELEAENWGNELGHF